MSADKYSCIFSRQMATIVYLFSDSAVRWLGSRSTDKLPRHNSFHKIIMTFIFPPSSTKCLCMMQTMFDHWA